ncbi:MAG: hypothetical protein HOW97_17525, partial [Catenulispora sp.]|nr:hypothetical protein [Catenulispora sp.]
VGVVAAVVLAGCGSQGTVGARPSASPAAHHPPQPLTGAQLSALINPPEGFALKTSGSSDSGAGPATPTPANVDPTTITCSDWWTGQGLFGPGEVAYTSRFFDGPDQSWASVLIDVLPDGKGAAEADSSVAIMKRCEHFTYMDRQSTTQYLVDMHPGAELKAGDRSWTYDATEKSPTGTLFPVQVTYVQAGDAFVVVTQGTGAAPAAGPDRTKLPIATWIGALQAAGY